MKKENISLLLHYLAAREEGKEPYFDADEIDQMLDNFEEADDYTYFEEILNLGLKLHPNNTDLQIRQCKWYTYNQDFESAMALMDALGLSNNESLDLVRIECLAMLDRYDDLIEYTETLVANHCSYLQNVFEYTSTLFSEIEMDEEAKYFIERGFELFPNSLTLKEELCYSKEVEGKLEEAIEICNELIDKNPYSFEYWATLGRLYSQTSEFDKAIEAFDFALTCNDSNPELNILKAYCLFMNESYEKALETYLAILMSPDGEKEEIRDQILPLMAECHIKMRNYEKAYNILKNVVDKVGTTTKEPINFINFIRCCEETERPEEAAQTLQKAVGLFPSNIRLLSMLALSYMQNGEEKLAMEATERLFDVLEDEKTFLVSEDFETLFFAGNFLYLKGDVQRAIKFYTKAYDFNPKLPFIHLHLAMAYLTAGDMKHFIEHIKQTTPDELMEYLSSAGFNMEAIKREMEKRHIPPEDLTKEFLRNKDNSN